MTPLLSMLAGAKAFGLTAFKGLFEPTGAYDALATITVGTAVSSVTFTGIPTGYKHLELRLISRNTVVGDQLFLQMNDDTGANYARHELSGNGSTANAYASTSQTSMFVAMQNHSSHTTGMFAPSVISILDYDSTSKNKTVCSLTGYDTNGSGIVALISGLWMNSTSAVTSIKFIQGNSGNFAQYSQFALYGVK